MSDPLLGLTMLGLIVVAIMMGFPTAFTLMGLGMIFGYIAFWDPAHHWWQNRAFDLMVQRTYGVMTNDTLLSVPLFVFMGYIMERAALVDRMFHSVQLAFRRVPASLAVTTLLVCAFWGIASGIVGAVVVLMGVIAMRPMLNAGYDVRLASGAITAGGTLGILIPPSVMLIVYAAVAGQSIVKLYAAAMIPGFFLTFLYLLYILGWAIINPKIAPQLPPDQYRVKIPEWLKRLERSPSKRVSSGIIAALFQPGKLKGATRPDGKPVSYGFIVSNVIALMVPLALTIGTYAGTWWYVVIHNAPATTTSPEANPQLPAPPALTDKPQELGSTEEKPQELGNAEEKPAELGSAESTVESTETVRGADAPPQEMTAVTEQPSTAPAGGRVVPRQFYTWFWTLAGLSTLLLLYYYWRMDGEQFEILKELSVAVVPLGVLTIVVLVVILLGICTATESAAIGALGALYLAVLVKFPHSCGWWSLLGAIIGVALGMQRGDIATLIVSGSLGATFVGTGIPLLIALPKSPELRRNLKEATFLTAKTTAMVCWLFIGSALFSAVFALHGGQGLIERWVLSLNLSPLGFQLVAQAIIFLLGWPLEWTEIIVIFCPIFIPLLSHFHVDPILFGTMVAVNLQAAFLSPPVAMSAFYLKGVAPKHVTLNQIFAGMMPYMIIVCLCLVCMYIWPGMTLWLPEFLYGN
ncbi:MAG TPA: TRAP transporter large permease subunit [Candidatus Limnocylindrales bacterium]|nr:TRAP transporter large permease subunit [Candidatus Limnocylindrales bacterium]